MKTNSSPPSAAFQAEIVNGVEGITSLQAKEAIRSEVLKMLSRNLSSHINDLVDSLRSAVALCNKLTSDVEEMQESVAACAASVKETKDKVPDQIIPLATTSASKALLESSKEQKLPPHLVNRLLSRNSLTKSGDVNSNKVRASYAKAPQDFFLIQAPPLPKYTPPDITLNLGGSIVIVPMQPPLILSASPAVGGISIEGRLDQSSLTVQFQPANVYYLYSYTPTEGDAIKVQLGIAWTKIAVITAPSLPLSFVAVNLPPNSVHFFVMHGVDALGRTGEWSNIVKAIVN